MNDTSKNNKISIKKTGFSIRTTESFLQILNKVADKKQMNKTELIEFLVRKEADKIGIDI